MRSLGAWFRCCLFSVLPGRCVAIVHERVLILKWQEEVMNYRHTTKSRYMQQKKRRRKRIFRLVRFAIFVALCVVAFVFGRLALDLGIHPGHHKFLPDSVRSPAD